MALALYRRYRPDTFEGVIGQDQVTVPLMRALDEGKLTHAYLFSGPRGCGKTSSARILARCVNCAQGPTAHPCGTCESCKDLATGGPGSIDVVEIDAASHNGVDDARELRERAGFAPARDRYKIFILDEAHMVTQQGFNALLKIVEEPPEHVMFIFATTEPDKVIGTIRSRTHHYPFRLVPQEVMGPYLEDICAKEGIKPEAGVLQLAMRAGGGSMRDTLSVLDQLMVGSVDGVITYESAVALLGFTPDALIGEAIDAVIARDGEALYGVVQKVVVGGFDPRRFVEDLLARVRDLLVLTLAGQKAESVLSDAAASEDTAHLRSQAEALGLNGLTGMADIINSTLSTMTGAVSPRMRLELLAARLLAAAERGFAAPAAAAPASASSAPAASAASADAARPRTGFIGSSRHQQTTAQPAQPVQVTQSAQPVQATQPAQPVTSAQPTVAASQTGSVPTASAEAPADNRSVDDKWAAALASLPQDIAEYVSHERVTAVAFGTNAKGYPCLSLTFDKPLSQYAFALAVDTASGVKAAVVVQNAVRAQFGAYTVIAPTPIAANGEKVASYSRMSPQEQAKVKQQIAAAKASALGVSLGAATGAHESDDAQGEQHEAQVDADDDAHRAAQSAAVAEPDPWAQPMPSAAVPTTTDAASHHEAKHVAVPDMSDDFDPWAQPASQQKSASEQAKPQGESAAEPSSGGTATASTTVADGTVDPWAIPAAAMTGETPAVVEEAASADDPWAKAADASASSAGGSGKDTKAGKASEAKTSEKTSKKKTQAKTQTEPQSDTPVEGAPVESAADEYSMSDVSLGEASAMNLDAVAKMFEVKKIEDFAADDPRNPAKAKSSKHKSE